MNLVGEHIPERAKVYLRYLFLIFAFTCWGLFTAGWVVWQDDSEKLRVSLHRAQLCQRAPSGIDIQAKTCLYDGEISDFAKFINDDSLPDGSSAALGLILVAILLLIPEAIVAVKRGTKSAAILGLVAATLQLIGCIVYGAGSADTVSKFEARFFRHGDGSRGYSFFISLVIALCRLGFCVHFLRAPADKVQKDHSPAYEELPCTTSPGSSSGSALENSFPTLSSRARHS